MIGIACWWLLLFCADINPIGSMGLIYKYIYIYPQEWPILMDRRRRPTLQGIVFVGHGGFWDMVRCSDSGCELDRFWIRSALGRLFYCQKPDIFCHFFNKTGWWFQQFFICTPTREMIQFISLTNIFRLHGLKPPTRNIFLKTRGNLALKQKKKGCAIQFFLEKWSNKNLRFFQCLSFHRGGNEW